jgi:hypothetical protein
LSLNDEYCAACATPQAPHALDDRQHHVAWTVKGSIYLRGEMDCFARGSKIEAARDEDVRDRLLQPSTPNGLSAGILTRGGIGTLTARRLLLACCIELNCYGNRLKCQYRGVQLILNFRRYLGYSRHLALTGSRGDALGLFF